MKIFGRDVDYIPCKLIKDVFTEVEKGRTDYGVVPIENSTEGAVNHTLDMFVDSDLKITSEIFLEISHCLLSNETSIQKIKEDYKNNFIRFLVLGKKNPSSSGCDKTSIMFSVKDRLGMLYDIFVLLKKYGLNLTKVKSRPSKTKTWKYIFFVDFVGHIEDKNVKKALAELEKSCSLLKVFGSYSTGD